MGIRWIDPIDVTQPWQSGWRAYDLSGLVSGSARGALLRVINLTSVDRKWGLRPAGSSQDLYDDLDVGAHTWDFVGLDGDFRFEARRESSAIRFELVGEFSPAARFFNDAIELPLDAISIGTYGTVGISGFTAGDTATAAFLVRTGPAQEFYARLPGSSVDARAVVDNRQPFIVPLNGAEQFEVLRESATALYLLGYDTDGYVFDADPVTIPTSDESWQDYVLPAGASGALVWITGSHGAGFGLRRDGVAGGTSRPVSERASYGAVEAFQDTIEVFANDAGEVSLYLLGYTVDTIAAALKPRDVEVDLTAARTQGIPGFARKPRNLNIAALLRRPWGRNLSLGRPRALQIESEATGAKTRAGKIAQGDQVLALIVRPYDTMIAQTMQALPVPLAYAPWTAGPEVMVTGAETAAYFSDVGLISDPADDPASTSFPGKLQQSYDFEARLFDQGEPAGRSSVSAGEITVINTDGEFDHLLDLGWAGRTIELYRGRKGRPFSSFQEVFRGTCEGIDWTNRGIAIRLRDRQDILRQPLQTAAYGGTGGLDGGEDLAGKLKPQAYGQCINVAPTLIDTANQVYQFHDRQAEAVLEVRDSGAILAAGVDWPDFDALMAATIPAATYDTCLACGLIRLSPLSAAAGLVTADVAGDAEGGFVATAADIVRRMVTTRPLVGQITDPEDLDAASFDTLNAVQPAVQQYYASSEQQPDIAEAVDRLMAGIGGYWFFTRRDKLRVGRLEAPAPGGQRLTAKDVGDNAVIERRLLQRPSRRRSVAWAQLWQVQDKDALASEAVTEEDKVFYSTERRVASASDDAVLTKHRLALDITTPALFVFQSDAETEAERLLALHGPPRDLYTVPVINGIFRFTIGESVNWTRNRFGLDGGRDFVVVGVRENAAARSTELELWG